MRQDISQGSKLTGSLLMELKGARDCASFLPLAAPVAPSPCRAAGQGRDIGQVGCGLLTGQQELKIQLRGDCQDSTETDSYAKRTPTW